MRGTWRHLRENPGWAVSLWLVNFVIFAVVFALSARFTGGETFSIGTLVLWPVWMATVETFVLTWWQLRQKPAPERAGSSAE